MEHMKNMLSKSMWLMVQCSILVACGAAHVLLMYTNYQALKISFELLNYDGTPVGRDLVWGPYWDSFGLYNLTQAHLFAAAIALIVGGLSIVACHHLYLTVRLLLDRKEYINAGNTADAEQALLTIYRHLLIMILTTIVLVPILNWDVDLFRYRSAAAALKLDETAVDMKNWALLLKERGDLFSTTLANNGAIAYIFVVIGISLLLELWLEYVKEAAARLGAAFNAWYDYISGANDDEPETAVPAESPAAYQAEFPTQTAYPAAEDSMARPTTTYPTERFQDEPVAPNIQPTNAVDINRLDSSSTEPHNYPNETSETMQESMEEPLVAVYGGEPDEKVKFSTAAVDTEHYIIDDMRRVWRRMDVDLEMFDEEPAAAAA